MLDSDRKIIKKDLIPRGVCLINGIESYFDFWNSKEKTKQNDSFEYLGYGRVVSARGVSKMHESSEYWTGHFWRNKNIPVDQNLVKG